MQHLNIDVEYKVVKAGAKAPSYATTGSAGADLYALTQDDVFIPAGETAVISTGICISLPSKNYVALIFARSGLAIKHGIALTNGVGVIDSDYRGEISVGLVNLSKQGYTVKNGDRIAQVCIMPVYVANFVQSSELNATQRGNGGLGSTGK